MVVTQTLRRESGEVARFTGRKWDALHQDAVPAAGVASTAKPRRAAALAGQGATFRPWLVSRSRGVKGVAAAGRWALGEAERHGLAVLRIPIAAGQRGRELQSRACPGLEEAAEHEGP